MVDNFWQDVAYDLLEMHLNQDGINSQILKSVFKGRPDVLNGMDFGEDINLENLDQHLYGKG